MRTQKTPTWLIIVLIIALAVVAMLMGAASCDKNQPDAPSRHPLPCATWQAPDGTWMEEDDEPVDSDPCDLDDAFEVPKVHTTAPKVKVSTKPAPRSSRR